MLIQTGIRRFQTFVYRCVDTEIKLINQSGVKSYLVEKLQEKNPLRPSNAYKAEYPVLIKRIRRLKILQRHYKQLLREGIGNTGETEQKLTNLNKKIIEYSTKLNLLSAQEKASKLHKLVTPCNLILPGSGNVVRVAAYTVRVISILKQKIHKMEEMKSVTKEISLTGSITTLSVCAYQTIKHLTNKFY
jgi:hypothetical protein